MSKCVIFDLDGTIYFGEQIAKYANEILTNLEKLGYEVLFLTNNSTKTREEILEKLQGLNINTSLNKIYTSSYATAKYLDEISIRNIFLIGTEGFKKELNLLNINVVDEAKAEAVVIGLDVKFNYEIISRALIAVNNGSKIIASNKDKNYPIENGVLRPGSNAILASLLGSCDDKEIDFIAGKPNTYLLEIICKDFQLHKDDIYVVGDSLESDIAMADAYGCKSILVGENSNNLKDVFKIIIKEG